MDVHHKVLGIIGIGGIGSAVARKRAHFGFGMNILYHNQSRNHEAEQRYGATHCSMEELLEQSDFVCLMTPLTPQTEEMIGKKRIQSHERDCYFYQWFKRENR